MPKKLQIQPAVSDRVKEVAARIYTERAAAGRLHAGNTAAVATEAFQAAIAFAEAEATFATDGVPQAIPAGYKPKVKFTHQRQENDGAWVDVLDDDGQPVVDETEGDPDAHAPNLPPSHPINVRFTKAREILGLEPVAIGN